MNPYSNWNRIDILVLRTFSLDIGWTDLLILNIFCYNYKNVSTIFYSMKEVPGSDLKTVCD